MIISFQWKIGLSAEMIAFKNYVAILLFHRLESRMNIQMKVWYVIHTTILIQYEPNMMELQLSGIPMN